MKLDVFMELFSPILCLSNRKDKKNEYNRNKFEEGGIIIA